MKKKILTSFGVLASIFFCVSIGVAISAYTFFYLEMNDRLKYEVAYLNGYVSAQKQLKKGDAAKAEEIMDLLIDAHAHTLYEFDYMSSSMLKTDMEKVLCKIVALRKEYPIKRSDEGDALQKWYKEIDQYLREKNWEC